MTSNATNLPVWNLSELYVSDHDPQIEDDRHAVEAAVRAFNEAWADRTEYLTDRLQLRAALDAYEALQRLLNIDFPDDGSTKPGYYFTLRLAENQTDKAVRARLAELTEWEAGLRSSVQFFAQNIGQITHAHQAEALADANLEPYWFWLRQRFTAGGLAYQTDELEALEVEATDETTNFDTALSAHTAMVWDGTTMVETPFGELTPMLSSGNPQVRASAANALNAILAEMAPEATRQLNAVVRARLAMAQLRGHQRADVARLIKDGFEPGVIDSMLEAVREQFSAAHDFYVFRTALVGAKRLPYAERTAPFGSAAATTLSFEKTVEIVRRVYALFGPWFVEQFDVALATGHIDAQPRPGKRTGAACWAPAIDLPPYLNISFTGTLRDVQVLAHEFGHYLEALLKKQSCTSLTYASPVALAEVCGVVIEFFVVQELLDDPELDDESRLALLLVGLDSEVIAIFRNTAATDFELELYREVAARGFLPQDAIDALFVRSMESYLGESIVMAGAEQWWVHWRHFRLGFYNQGYVFAGLVARALRARVVEEPAFTSKIVEIMSGGTRLSPQDLLASAGLDITDVEFWRSGVESWCATLREAKALAQRLGLV